MTLERRKRCVICGLLSHRCMRINGGSPYCHDGYFSTTGRDRRSPDGKPLWEAPYKGMSLKKLRAIGITEIGVTG